MVFQVLHQDKAFRPRKPKSIAHLNHSDLEIKKTKGSVGSIVVEDPRICSFSYLHQLLARYSTFDSVIRKTAWLLRFVAFLKHKHFDSADSTVAAPYCS